MDVCEKKFDRTDRWIFRGQADTEWTLKTRFERSVLPYVKSGNTPIELERIMLREFKRHYHRYSADLPAEEDDLEWLSVMQHYGAPTRLLDWTYSEYVALFFAIRDAEPKDAPIAIWAVNQTQCWNHLIGSLKKARHNGSVKLLTQNDKNSKALNSLLSACAETIVAPINPLRLSDRLSVQQGTFLVPMNPNLSFKQNFDKSFESMPHGAAKITIPCNDKNLLNALTLLVRVNITERSLFPGIDGLARSMKLSAILKHLYPQGVK